jgi:hypothetical protein
MFRLFSLFKIDVQLCFMMVYNICIIEYMAKLIDNLYRMCAELKVLENLSSFFNVNQTKCIEGVSIEMHYRNFSKLIQNCKRKLKCCTKKQYTCTKL